LRIFLGEGTEPSSCVVICWWCGKKSENPKQEAPKTTKGFYLTKKNYQYMFRQGCDYKILSQVLGVWASRLVLDFNNFVVVRFGIFESNVCLLIFEADDYIWYLANGLNLKVRIEFEVKSGKKPTNQIIKKNLVRIRK
jgi:hypothetical protein